MLLDDVKPLMIVWTPISVFGLKETSFSSLLKSADSSFLNDAVDFVLRRTSENEKLIGAIPIPFYFYERLSEAKDATDDSTGFLLDDIGENINVSYPETPTANLPANTKAGVVVVRNTINVNFRVKQNSTLVSVFRLLLKRLLTNYDTAVKLRFSFFWREYVLSYCKMIDYDEEPVKGTDLVLLKMKLETYQPTTLAVSESGTQLLTLPNVGYTYL